MPLTPYRRGSDKERRIVNSFKKKGYLSFRSAGSHSIIDVIAIDPTCKVIRLIQSKLRGKKNLSKPERERIYREGERFSGDYKVIFELWA